jgi:flagellar basal body-associated protein FliL
MGPSPNGRVVLIILLVTSVLFFLAFVILLFVYFFQLSNLIDPANCPAAVNNYAVLPSYTGTVTATFTAASLQDAVNVCNGNTTQCSQFIWTQDAATVSFVTNPVPSTDPNLNLYIRPVPT